MLDFSRVQNYYIACGYTDMRKQIDGLAALVQTQFGQEMDDTSLYLFCGRRAGVMLAGICSGMITLSTGPTLDSTPPIFIRFIENREFGGPRHLNWDGYKNASKAL